MNTIATTLCVCGAVLFVAYLHGVDVLPGRSDEILPTPTNPEQDFLVVHDNTFDDVEPGVVRLLTHDGIPITEEDELKLRPLLEALEIAVESAGASQSADASTEVLSLKSDIEKLHILPSEQVDGLNGQKINAMLTQFGATASSSEHLTRVTLAGMAVLHGGYSGIPVFMHAFVYNLALPFLPKGHPETTAGRHDDGGRTWYGLRRADLALFLIVQYSVMYTANAFVFLKTYGMSVEDRQKKGTAGKQFRSLFLNVRRGLDVIIACLFIYVGWRLVAAAPEGWLIGGFFTNGMVDPSECTAEFHSSLGGEMHFAFLVFAGFQMFETIVVVLNVSIHLAKPDVVIGRLSGLPVWFWYLVMYFTPYDDAAFPMLLECFRLISSALFRFFKREDMYFGPLTQALELAHMIGTIFFNCHYPKVLFIRFPKLWEGTRTVMWNAHWLCRKIISPSTSGLHWVASLNTDHVTVYVPSEDESAQPLPGRPGRWLVKENVCVRLAKEKMTLEMEGAMRDPLHLYDEEGVLFKDQLLKDGLGDLDPYCLLYKRYKSTKDMDEDVTDVTFRDAHMQYKAHALAKEFNKRLSNTRNRIAFAPAAVMLYNGDYYGVEPFLDGHYKRYGNNGLFPDALLSTDEIPGCFSHFTYEYTGKSEIVVDIQGVENSKGSLRYIFTDPQMHSVPKTDENGTLKYGKGNFGNFGMQKFQTGHVCGKYCKSIGNTNFAATNAVTREQQEREENEAQKRELKKLEHVGGILAFACLVYSIELLLATYLPNWNFVDPLARAVVYLIAGGGMFMFIERRVLKRKVA